MENVWRLKTFEALLGQTLIAKELEGSNVCQLTVKEVVKSESLGEGWESFSVIFECDKEISQGSLTVTHSDHDDFSIFLSPKSEVEHEAVFSYQV